MIYLFSIYVQQMHASVLGIGEYDGMNSKILGTCIMQKPTYTVLCM